MTQMNRNMTHYETEKESGTLRRDGWLPRRSGSKTGMDREFGLSRCKLVYILIEWAKTVPTV